jgi:hypothetical protein
MHFFVPLSAIMVIGVIASPVDSTQRRLQQQEDGFCAKVKPGLWSFNEQQSAISYCSSFLSRLDIGTRRLIDTS